MWDVNIRLHPNLSGLSSKSLLKFGHVGEIITHFCVDAITYPSLKPNAGLPDLVKAAPVMNIYYLPWQLRVISDIPINFGNSANIIHCNAELVPGIGYKFPSLVVSRMF